MTGRAKAFKCKFKCLWALIMLVSKQSLFVWFYRKWLWWVKSCILFANRLYIQNKWTRRLTFNKNIWVLLLCWRLNYHCVGVSFSSSGIIVCAIRKVLKSLIHRQFFRAINNNAQVRRWRSWKCIVVIIIMLWCDLYWYRNTNWYVI